MIDLHTHLLPNIDDGASDISEALIMTKLLKEEGIKGPYVRPIMILPPCHLMILLAYVQNL